MITQQELNTYHQYKVKLKGKKEKIALVDAKLRDLEDALLSRVRAKEKVEEGKRCPYIEVTEKRSLSWKDVVCGLKGEAFVLNKIQDTKAVKKEKLVVKECSS